MTQEYDSAGLDQQAFASGWEKEHGTDYGDFLDSLLDPDDPLHGIAVGVGGLIAKDRYLPDVELIPPCPLCGDADHTQLVVVGLPASAPAADERDRVSFAGCLIDDDTLTGPWWCPTCDQGYAWSYPFERTLLIKEPWLSMLIDGHKTWELRRLPTKVGGVVGLTPPGSGEIAGRAELVTVHGPLSATELRDHRDKHWVDDGFLDSYAAGKPLYAWEFQDAHRFESPAPYDHPQGAEIWVKLPTNDRPTV